MKRIASLFTPISAITLLLLSNTAFTNDLQEGEKLYKTHCSACHGMAGGMDLSQRIAPPIIGVRKHYIDVHPEKQAFIAAVSTWLETQDESKSLMRGAIQRFKIMPPITIAKVDAEKIATYIYEGKLEKPAGFDKHIAMMHGDKMHVKKKGMMCMKSRRGMKMIMGQLNLSLEQQQQIQPLIQSKKQVMMPLKKRVQQINQQIQDLDTTHPNYKASIFSLADEKGKLVYRMVIEKGEMRMKIEAILTPEQRKKFAELKAQRSAKKQDTR